jgi:hypothetical protein
MAMMNIYISHAGNYDYVSELYEPLKKSELFGAHRFFLPHESQNTDVAAKDELQQTDLLIAEASYPSTGQGIELGLANMLGVPIICFHRAETRPSGSLRFVTDTIITYNDTPDLLAKIAARLS